MRSRSPGFAAPILVLVLVCVALTFTVAGLSTFQLTASQQSSRSDMALYLAEGALSQTLSRLHDGLIPPATQFGRSLEMVSYVPDPTQAQNQGQVSFDPATPWGFSTNNFDGTTPAGWGGVQVPEGMALVVAHGVTGTSTRTIEAYLCVPTYQYVIAVDGGLATSGSLLARAETSMAALATDTANNTPNTTLPANIGANGNVTAGSGSIVTGDLVASGTVDLAAPSTVDGVVEQAPVAVPQLSVTTFINDFVNSAGVNPPAPTLNPAGDTTVAQDCFSSGDLAVPMDLVLNQAYLYVNGNLTVNGALRGTGAVFVNGEVSIGDGSDVSASNLVAVLSTGDVTLQGPATAQKFFQGLVYCEGAFSASNITVAGAFVSASNPSESTAHGAPGVTLNNAPVVYVPPAGAITTAWASTTTSTTVVSPTQIAPPSAAVYLTTSPTWPYLSAQTVGTRWEPTFTPPPSNPLATSSTASVTTTTVVDLDLNNFLSDQTPLKVVSWRDVSNY